MSCATPTEINNRARRLLIYHEKKNKSIEKKENVPIT